MKFYLKVFLLSMIVTSLLVGSGLFAYLNYLKREVTVVDVTNSKNDSVLEKEEKPDVNYADLTSFEDLVEYSNRVNILVLGNDGGRADTIMFVSYDPDYQIVDILTVPRDTYNEVPGYDKPGQHKINSVFGYGQVDGGSNGMKTQVSKLLGVPIHHFVTLDYKAVKDIVKKIRIRLTEDEEEFLEKSHTVNPETYKDYLRGLHYLNQGTEESFETGIK